MEKLLACMHDVCNKLSMITMSAKLMQKKCEKCPKRDDCGGCPNSPILADIVTACASVSDIIHSHRKDGKDQLTGRSYNLSNILTSDSLLCQKVIQLGKETDLDVTIKNTLPDDVAVSFNLDFELEGIQFLNNIFFNAKKANATHMRIVCADMRDHVVIHFIDDGNGMSSETIHCLGLSVASKTSTGEGTSILKKLAVKANGTIEWNSAGKGAGCCVSLRLSKDIS